MKKTLPIIGFLLLLAISIHAFQENIVQSSADERIYTHLDLLKDLATPTLSFDENLHVEDAIKVEVSSEDSAEIIGVPLAYPTPFRLREGTRIGYRLSKSVDVKIRIYNSRAQKLATLDFPAGSNGGRSSSYNRVAINANTFSGYPLSVGIYFFVITAEDKLLGKGRIGILP